MTDTNPITGEPMGAWTAEDRISLVRGFDREQCLAALNLPNLQATVRAAVAKRIRLLEANRYAELSAGGGVQRSGTG
jgi:hypothetical protein